MRFDQNPPALAGLIALYAAHGLFTVENLVKHAVRRRPLAASDLDDWEGADGEDAHGEFHGLSAR